MDSEYIIMGNKVIAEFMGELSVKGFINHLAPEIENIKDNVYSSTANDRPLYYLGQAKYYCSWDWLMPVIEKIGRSKFDDFDKNRSISEVLDKIFSGSDRTELMNSIESIFRSTVQYLNKTHKQ